MDFTLTDEQRMLRDVARKRLEAAPAGPVPELEALGWNDPALTAVDAAVLAEEAGRAGAHLTADDEPGTAGDRSRALTLSACEAVGLARAALESACGHARTRVQFGRPIGSFQAVSHRLAEVHTRLELAASLAYRAAWCLGNAPDETEEAALAAAIASREAAVEACEAEIQCWGAAGFVWEHPANRRYRRALWLASFLGTRSAHRAALAAVTLGG
jgi:hypothetical protein